MDHPFAHGEKLHDVTFENVQAGLRTDYLFRLANQKDGIVLGTGDLSELALGWCTYGVGDQMSHYNVNAGVPKTLIQHLIRWVAELRAILRRDLGNPAGDPRHGDFAGARAPPRTASRRRARRRRSAPTPCRISTCSTSCGMASARRRSHSWPCRPGATRRAAHGPRVFQTRNGSPTTCRSFATGCACSCSVTSASASSSAPPCRTARKCRPAVRSPPAATGGRRRTAMRACGWRNWIGTCRRIEPRLTGNA